ncbi:trypsin-like peptidase domain-containing protein [Anoxybacillus flavithermus]|nr:trypsin-like peptidase domain-containing protein [Anoxybacillus flavithermus]
MYCGKCGSKNESSAKFCGHCGISLGRRSSKWIIFLLVAMACVSVVSASFAMKYWKVNEKKIEDVKSGQIENKEIVEKKEIVVMKTSDQDMSKLIAEAQEKVFTIFTDYGQGSGFLINDKGDVLTNAHVVEGDVQVVVRNKHGEEFEGMVIGYSNMVDVALVRVPALKNRSALPLETKRKAAVGEEVITLGSPMGLENTATFGYISGVDRNFIIHPHVYENVYQISAPIAPGSSGGPLLEKKTGKVLAINSARASTEETFGFSIPIFQVYSLIQKWVSSPLDAEEVYALFYNDQGAYYYGSLEGEGYFDGGDYSEEYDNYDVWGYDESYEEDMSGYDESYEEDMSGYDESYEEDMSGYDESYEEDMSGYDESYEEDMGGYDESYEEGNNSQNEESSDLE